MNNADKPAIPCQQTDTNGVVVDEFYGLTKREYACIKLLIPQTGDEVLDGWIMEARRHKTAAKAMTAVISNPDSMREITAACKDKNIEHEFSNVIARAGIMYADALIKELKS